jgi:hypothetical protein
MSLVSSPVYTGPALIKSLHLDGNFDTSGTPFRTWKIGLTQTRQTEVTDVPDFVIPGEQVLMDSSFIDDTPAVPRFSPGIWLGPDGNFQHDMNLNMLVSLTQFSLFVLLAHSANPAAESLQGLFVIYTGIDPTTAGALMAG